jgi:hypothetical protein
VQTFITLHFEDEYGFGTIGVKHQIETRTANPDGYFAAGRWLILKRLQQRGDSGHRHGFEDTGKAFVQDCIDILADKLCDVLTGMKYLMRGLGRKRQESTMGLHMADLVNGFRGTDFQRTLKCFSIQIHILFRRKNEAILSQPPPPSKDCRDPRQVQV